MKYSYYWHEHKIPLLVNIILSCPEQKALEKIKPFVCSLYDHQCTRNVKNENSNKEEGDIEGHNSIKIVIS